MRNILIFAGTTEGRQLAERICANHDSEDRFFISVATDYGKALLPKETPGITILSDRLAAEEMKQLIADHQINLVIDATHPYATQVSENIRRASDETGIQYERLTRAPETIEEDAVLVKDSKEAASYLLKKPGRALLAIGSKELPLFTELKDRVYPRILPTPEMVEKAFRLGFDAGNLICMQGPFSFETNVAMLKQIDAKYLVTKESGKAGGFAEKAAAARAAGAKLVVIGRPNIEKGLTINEALAICGVKIGSEKGQWFPLFVNIDQKQVVVVGGGKIASRRIKTFLNFSCRLRVIAEDAQDWIVDQHQQGHLDFRRKSYDAQDLAGADYVLAATNNEQVNLAIGSFCQEKKIPVNVAHRKEDCDFYFPGLIRQNGLTVGLTAEGKDHRRVAEGKRLIAEVLEKGTL